MKAFAKKYLERMESQTVQPEDWEWTPAGGQKSLDVYASGNNTKSRESTYASEKDDRSDEDRPNEGFLAA